MKVELVTPQKKLFAVDADSVSFSGSNGEMTVLPGHIPMITGLKPGPLVLRREGGQEIYAVGGGVAQIDGARVAILAESAEPAGEIDVARAEKARQAAEQALRDQSFYDETFAETQAQLARATARIDIARR
ncbi:MAG: ATP synthase F1 subunit epsilon [Deltaproteobacteria bacterium]|nr:ATP synthase F1 subunit epsilon [Deltaproteobacteria bacterium]